MELSRKKGTKYRFLRLVGIKNHHIIIILEEHVKDIIIALFSVLSISWTSSTISRGISVCLISIWSQHHSLLLVYIQDYKHIWGLYSSFFRGLLGLLKGHAPLNAIYLCFQAWLYAFWYPTIYCRPKIGQIGYILGF